MPENKPGLYGIIIVESCDSRVVENIFEDHDIALENVGNNGYKVTGEKHKDFSQLLQALNILCEEKPGVVVGGSLGIPTEDNMVNILYIVQNTLSYATVPMEPTIEYMMNYTPRHNINIMLE